MATARRRAPKGGGITPFFRHPPPPPPPPVPYSAPILGAGLTVEADEGSFPDPRPFILAFVFAAEITESPKHLRPTEVPTMVR